MYKVYVPIYGKKLSATQKNKLLYQLNKAKADFVFLTTSRCLTNEIALYEELEILQENRDFLTKNGFEVGAWLCPGVGYGFNKSWGDGEGCNDFFHLKSLRNNQELNGAFCPMDKRFVNEICTWVQKVAKMGIKTILFDDDFCFSGKHPDFICCCCDLHMQEYEKRIMGKTDNLYEEIFSGGKNKYRDIWLELQGETLCSFANEIRKSVDLIDSTVRIGLCANRTSFDLEGVSIIKLSKIIAGNTTPLIRLTGAPYWNSSPVLGTKIECIRTQANWACDNGIEMLAEGDTFPRPRYCVSSAELECYDMVLRANGGLCGILKYMIDYTSDADYETGYVDGHCRNFDNYNAIVDFFGEKQAVGLNVVENMEIIRNKEFGVDSFASDYGETTIMPFVSHKFMCDNSIPLTYGKNDCASVAFGENGRYITDETMKNGVIIDALSAKILMQRGIDIGIEKISRTASPNLEYFEAENEFNVIDTDGIFYEFSLNSKATVLSEFMLSAGGLAVVKTADAHNLKKFCACYLYENKNNQKFMVYSFVAESIKSDNRLTRGVSKSYCRQRQLAYGIEYLQKKPLVAMCFSHPYLYILCKQNENSLAVGLWNFSLDTVFAPTVKLSCDYKHIKCYNALGKLKGQNVSLSTDIAPYNFVCFEVYN